MSTVSISANTTTDIITVKVYEAAMIDGVMDLVVKSANFTAENDTGYLATATLTVTDPTPTEGKGYSVTVRNGTATIGGTAYTVAGTIIQRIYHSGAWASYPHKSTLVSADITDATIAAIPSTIVKRGIFGEAAFGSLTEGNDATAISAESISGTGANCSSQSGIGVLGVSESGIGASGESTSSTGVKALSESGSYHAEFGTTVPNKSFVARVLGAFGWWRRNIADTADFNGRIQAPATLEADAVWTLPAVTCSLANGDTNTGDNAVNTSSAPAIQTKTTDFSAAVGGRYITESAGKISITDPTTRAGGAALVAGDSYETWVGSGQIWYNGAGVSYSASRFSIRRRYTGSAWSTPAPMLSDTMQVGSNTWDGSTFTGPQAFSSTTRPTSAGTGTPAATSLITLTDGDTRYGSIIIKTLASDFELSSTSTTPLATVTGMTADLDANSIYEIRGFLAVITTGGTPTTNRAQFRLAYSGNLKANQGFVNGLTSGGAFFPMVYGGFLTTAIADVSNVDRSLPIIGYIVTDTSGTVALTYYKIQGSSNPTLKASSVLTFRKL